MVGSLFANILLALFFTIVAGKNPFVGHKFYVNPVNAKEFDSSIETSKGLVKDNLLRMQKVPSAYWIDVKAKVRGNDTRSLEGILKDAASKTPPELVVFIWYDLPNRDCDAKASNGEICCYKNKDGTCDYEKVGDCEEGLKEYFSEYADPFVKVLKKYQEKVPIVVVVEPDSLPNLATNLDHPHCGNKATVNAYTKGIGYALEQLSTETPSVAVYLDAAHGGWAGWEDNLEKFMLLLKKARFPMKKIRGFATNVANYQPLGVQCPFCPDQGYRNAYCLNGRHKEDPCCEDPCELLGQFDPGNNELNYAQDLVIAADDMLGMHAHVVIDTGRNGVGGMRTDCKNWCNPRDAGTGVPSTTDVANKTLVDAYFWLKTPGESDGCSETLPNGKKCPRFDMMCGSVDSLGTKKSEPPAPEAGHWFDFQVKQLAKNARFEEPKTPKRPKKNATKGHYGICGVGFGGQQQQQQQQQHQQQQQQQKQQQKQQQLQLQHQQHDRKHHQGRTGPVRSTNESVANNSATSEVRPAHSSSSDACADAFQQCDGKTGSAGPGCCKGVCECRGDASYKQCRPPANAWNCDAPNQDSVHAGSIVVMKKDEETEAPVVSLMHRRTPGPAALLLSGLFCGLAVAGSAAAWRRSPRGSTAVLPFEQAPLNAAAEDAEHGA